MAERLHREAALLSNRLHTFADSDVDGVRPVIAQIVAKRKEWRGVREQMLYVEKFGALPPDAVNDAVPDAVIGDASADYASAAELQVALSRLNVNLSKTEKKLREQPEHRKAGQWTEDVARLRAEKLELQKAITLKKYAKG